jgi:hypothetical protein
MAGLYMHTFVACALVRPRKIYNLDELDIRDDDDGTQPTTGGHHFATASFLSLASIASSDLSKWLSPSGTKRINQKRPEHQSLCELRHNDCIYGSKSRQLHQTQAHSQGDISRDGLLVLCGKDVSNNKPCHQSNEHIAIHNNLIKQTAGATQNDIMLDPDQENTNGARTSTSFSHIWAVICNKNLVLLNCNLLFVNASFGIVFIHFADFFYSQGMTQSELSMLMMLIGCCSITCRILIGALTSNAQISVLMIYISGGGLTSIFIILCPILSHTPTGRVIFAIGIGFYGNMYNGLLAPLTLSLCTLEELSMAYGIELFTCGISALLGPPFAG